MDIWKKGAEVMKKSMKILGIIAGIFAALGLMFIIIGGLMGGGVSVAEDVANNRLVLGLKDKISLNVKDVDTSNMNLIEEGNNQFAKEEIKSVALYGKYGEFEVNVGKENYYYIEVLKGASHVKYSLENGELKIATAGTIINSWRTSPKVKFYVPEDAVLETVKLDIGAGELTFSNIVTNTLDVNIGAGEGVFNNITASEVKFNVGAGEAEIAEANFTNCDLKIGMGDIELNGTILGNVDIDCGTGSVGLELSNRYGDFNYQVKVGAGEVDLGEQEYSGIGNNVNLNNNAGHTMNIKCGMGEVSAEFLD